MVPLTIKPFREAAMKRLLTLLIVGGIGLAPAPSLATYGDNLIGVGPISRAMGGVGIYF
jgi:CsoR family transcriptional regulator, copper-sensing transcriptional repressor